MSGRPFLGVRERDSTTMRTFVVIDRESLEEALAQAGPKDKIVIAEGAFEKPPRLVLDGGRWMIADEGLAVQHWDLT